MIEEDTQQLLSLARSGDLRARERLFVRYGPRLRRMIRTFLDPRLSARIDPSDVLQSAMAQAAVRFPEYFDNPAIAFYTWLRQITRHELIQVHRQHVQAQRRSIDKEERLDVAISDASAMDLANRLVGKEPSPSQRANLNELHQQVKKAMAKLPHSDCEILLMRCAEHLRMKEIAEIMAMSETAAKSRFRRAVQRLSRLVGTDHD